MYNSLTSTTLYITPHCIKLERARKASTASHYIALKPKWEKQKPNRALVLP